MSDDMNTLMDNLTTEAKQILLSRLLLEQIGPVTIDVASGKQALVFASVNDRYNGFINPNCTESLKSRQVAVVLMIDNLNLRNFASSYIERVLGLPQRSLKAWKENGASPEAAALLMVLMSEPGVLERIDKGKEQP